MRWLCVLLGVLLGAVGTVAGAAWWWLRDVATTEGDR